MPTPFLRRIRNHELSSPIASREASRGKQQPIEPILAPETRAGYGKHSLSPALSSLRATTDRDLFAIYESVFRALDSLLRATCRLSNPQIAAPRSLMAMCLRKVPGCVAELENMERETDKENGTKSAIKVSQVSSEIYSELESLGTVDGWKHLCLVVRAHGVRIVQEAVMEGGLLTDAMVDVLIQLCLQYLPPTECLDLVESFVYRQYPSPLGFTDDLSSPALSPLRYLSAYSEDRSFWLGRVNGLLEQGLLPSSWILTKIFRDELARAAQQIPKKAPSYQEVVDFMSVGLELLCHLTDSGKRKSLTEDGFKERHKAQKILSGTLAAICSLVVLARERAESGSDHDGRFDSLNSRIQFILRCRIEKRKGIRGTKHGLGTYMLNLCVFLFFQASDEASDKVETAWHDANNRKDNEGLSGYYDATLALVGATSHLCSRGTSRKDHFSVFCDKLEALDLPADALTNLRVDGAFYLAEHSGDLRDLAFAESLRAKIHKPAPKKSASRERSRVASDSAKTSHSGFRWDDDIGEWVVASAATFCMPASCTSSAAIGTRALRPRTSISSTPRAATPPYDEADTVSTDDESDYNDGNDVSDYEGGTQSPITPDTESTTSFVRSCVSPATRSSYSRRSSATSKALADSDFDSDELAPKPAIKKTRQKKVIGGRGYIRRSASLLSLKPMRRSGSGISSLVEDDSDDELSFL
ncbi:hypothetical protein OQA88_510 [Cercophora sp. LCS_1]